jgi:hydrogenase nickel incorporation protein HypB
MCETCGCGQTSPAIIRKPGEQYKYIPAYRHEYTADHEHHSHDHDHGHGRELNIELNIMNKNDLLAERNRGYFEAKKIFAINMVSSPGSGKTSILERTIKESAGMAKMYIIEGDQQTMLDADRIGKAGAPVVQVNTGNGCHLDAEMINQAVKKLDVTDGSILMIENVGNLVCPALFDLGESRRVVIISVTEGEDKPLKYPNMFQTAQLCLINKSDLLPYVDFNLDKVKEYALRVNHHLDFLTVSAKTGEGFGEWLAWLKKTVNM